MKYILAFLSTITIAVHAQQVSTQLSGVIKNNTAKEVVIKDGTNKDLLKLPIESNKVKGQITLPKGEYKMSIGEEYTDIYLDNGDLSFTIDLKEFDESIKYTGSLAAENNYLASKLLRAEKFRKAKMFFDKEVNVFLDSINKVFSVNDKELSSKNLKADFIKYQKESNKIEHYNNLMMYASYHPYLTKKENFELPDSYYHFLKDINVNDSNYIHSPSYIGLLGEYFGYIQSKRMSKDEAKGENKMTLGKLDLIRSQVNVGAIRNVIVSMEYKYNLTQASNLEELKNAYIETAADPSLKKEIEEFVTKLMNLKEGSVAPAFTLTNNRGQKKSLSDYKGKYVYLDIWATWCGPCRAELPHYEEIKKLYKNKNIEFVSICVWDKKDAWDKFLKDKNLGGEQLFNPQEDKDFTDSYMVQGVPKFVLIDKEGKLISHEAERPSDTALKTRLDGLLK